MGDRSQIQAESGQASDQQDLAHNIAGIEMHGSCHRPHLLKQRLSLRLPKRQILVIKSANFCVEVRPGSPGFESPNRLEIERPNACVYGTISPPDRGRSFA
jgi:hypothetical protein